MVKNPGGKKGGQGAGTKGGRRRFYVTLAGLLIGGIALLSYLAVRPGQAVSQLDPALTPIPNQGHVMGRDSALVEVVEFADFECPACGQFANITEPDVRARLVNTGLVRFRFMDYPLPIHRNTWSAHNAAWCAGEQGKFWEMHDAIFQNQDRWSSQATRRPDNVLAGLARQIGLNVPQYESCVSTRKFQPQIQSNYNEAQRLGVQSTPTFLIGTRRIPGNISYDELKRYVDEAAAPARAARPATTPPR